jgi:hypothetical protein
MLSAVEASLPSATSLGTGREPDPYVRFCSILKASIVQGAGMLRLRVRFALLASRSAQHDKSLSSK